MAKPKFCAEFCPVDRKSLSYIFIPTTSYTRTRTPRLPGYIMRILCVCVHLFRLNLINFRSQKLVGVTLMLTLMADALRSGILSCVVSVGWKGSRKKRVPMEWSYLFVWRRWIIYIPVKIIQRAAIRMHNFMANYSLCSEFGLDDMICKWWCKHNKKKRPNAQTLRNVTNTQDRKTHTHIHTQLK